MKIFLVIAGKPYCESHDCSFFCEAIMRYGLSIDVYRYVLTLELHSPLEHKDLLSYL